MTDHLVSPERQITIGEQKFTLDPSFKTLKALQHAFDKDILDIQAGVLTMRLDEIAKLIAIASLSDEDVIGQLLIDQMDITGPDYQLLKADIMVWLALVMTPKRDREKKAQEMTALIEKLKSHDSLGQNTKDSPSDTSDGPLPHSGEVTPGS